MLEVSTASPKVHHSPAAGSAAVRARIEGLKNLPASLRVLQQALIALEEPYCSNARLQEILSRDPAATADILRLANSPYFGVGSQVRTISVAIVVIGHLRLETLLRHLMVSKLFYIFTGGSRADSARKRAVAAGAACYNIASGLGLPDSEEIRIGGLLHNIGQLALLSEFPEGYRRVEEMAERMPLPEAECAEFGVPAEAVSGWMLRGWRFPDYYLHAAEQWRDPEIEFLKEMDRRFVHLVHIGAVMGTSWTEGLPDRQMLEQLKAPALESLKADEQFLIPIYKTLFRYVEEIEQTL